MFDLGFLLQKAEFWAETLRCLFPSQRNTYISINIIYIIIYNQWFDFFSLWHLSCIESSTSKWKGLFWSFLERYDESRCPTEAEALQTRRSCLTTRRNPLASLAVIVFTANKKLLPSILLIQVSYIKIPPRAAVTNRKVSRRDKTAQRDARSRLPVSFLCNYATCRQHNLLPL